MRGMHALAYIIHKRVFRSKTKRSCIRSSYRTSLKCTFHMCRHEISCYESILNEIERMRLYYFQSGRIIALCYISPDNYRLT